MDAAPQPARSDVMRAEKRAVALNSIFAALAITAGKFIVGVTSGSLAVLSEALSSLMDLVMTIMTFLSVRVSDKPADADHQYGHGKFENLSAFIETGLLLLTCAWIVWEAVKRLFYQRAEVELSVWVFAVLVGSIVVDVWRSNALKKVAVRYGSQALEADALHFRTDIWQVLVVLLGLALVWVGDRFGIAWLYVADPIAALIVAALIVYVSSRLARQTIDALLDAAPAGVRNQIMDAVAQVDGVLDVERVRIRRGGNRYFAELEVGLRRTLTFQKSEQVALAVSRAVTDLLPDADVVVRSVPRAAGGENIFERVRAVATRNNLNVHDVSVQDVGGKLHVEQHLELDETLSLRDAHELVTRIEAEIRGDVPEINSILTHIESEPATIEAVDEVPTAPELERRFRRIAQEFPEIEDVHDVTVKKVGGRLYVSCHVTMPDDLALARVHDISTALEIRFKQDTPVLFKVLIHTEPQTDNRR